MNSREQWTKKSSKYARYSLVSRQLGDSETSPGTSLKDGRTQVELFELLLEELDFIDYSHPGNFSIPQSFVSQRLVGPFRKLREGLLASRQSNSFTFAFSVYQHSCLVCLLASDANELQKTFFGFSVVLPLLVDGRAECDSGESTSSFKPPLLMSPEEFVSCYMFYSQTRTDKDLKLHPSYLLGRWSALWAQTNQLPVQWQLDPSVQFLLELHQATRVLDWVRVRKLFSEVVLRAQSQKSMWSCVLLNLASNWIVSYWKVLSNTLIKVYYTLPGSLIDSIYLLDVFLDPPTFMRSLYQLPKTVNGQSPDADLTSQKARVKTLVDTYVNDRHISLNNVGENKVSVNLKPFPNKK